MYLMIGYSYTSLPFSNFGIEEHSPVFAGFSFGFFPESPVVLCRCRGAKVFSLVIQSVSVMMIKLNPWRLHNEVVQILILTVLNFGIVNSPLHSPRTIRSRSMGLPVELSNPIKIFVIDQGDLSLS